MKVIAFDCYGTVFNAAGVPLEEARDYGRQARQVPWRPLVLPKSWGEMPSHPDSAEGIRRLRAKHRVVTCSNLPARLLCYLSDRNSIRWDAIVPLEASQSCKPNQQAYWTVCDVMQVDPEDVTVVSAHANGPDVEGAPNARMGFQLIRNPGCPQTIIELAEQLGC